MDARGEEQAQAQAQAHAQTQEEDDDEDEEGEEESEGKGGTSDSTLLALLDVLRCPIGNALLTDPVVAADGHTYERTAIETCFRAYPRSTPSPATGEVLPSHALVPNVMLRAVLRLLD